MQGFVVRKGNQHYAVIYEGLDPLTGRERRRWHPGGADRAEAEAFASRLAFRLHAGIGYVTPDDEHDGRGPAIRKAREAGLEAARLRRLTYHRHNHLTQPDRGPEDVG